MSWSQLCFVPLVLDVASLESKLFPDGLPRWGVHFVPAVSCLASPPRTALGCQSPWKKPGKDAATVFDRFFVCLCSFVLAGATILDFLLSGFRSAVRKTYRGLAGGKRLLLW